MGGGVKAFTTLLLLETILFQSRIYLCWAPIPSWEILCPMRYPVGKSWDVPWQTYYPTWYITDGIPLQDVYQYMS